MGRKCDQCGGDYFAKGKCKVHYRMPSQLNPKPTTKQTNVIAKFSDKRKKINAAYNVLRDQYMKAHPVCEARLPGCTYNSTECHHSRGRGEFMLDQTTYKALCEHCHRYVELHPIEAKKLGLSASRLSA